jgi:hypothetical protein
MKKLLIFCMAILSPMYGTRALLLCEFRFASPTSCSSYSPTAGNYETTWSVFGCSGGGSTAPASFAGEMRCSDTSGTYAVQGNPSTSSGQYCWCALNSPALSAYVFLYGVSAASSCSQGCANGCAYYTLHNSDFRSALFNAIL